MLVTRKFVTKFLILFSVVDSRERSVNGSFITVLITL